MCQIECQIEWRNVCQTECHGGVTGNQVIWICFTSQVTNNNAMASKLTTKHGNAATSGKFISIGYVLEKFRKMVFENKKSRLLVPILANRDCDCKCRTLFWTHTGEGDRGPTSYRARDRTCNLKSMRGNACTHYGSRRCIRIMSAYHNYEAYQPYRTKRTTRTNQP